MERFIKYRWWFLVHLFVMEISYLIHPLLGDKFDHLYYKGVALAWCIPPLFLTWCFGRTKALDVLIVFSAFALNNFMDELFFDTQKLQLNEVIFAISTIIAIIVIKCKTNSTTKQ